MASAREKSRNRFYSRTQTKRGNFWQVYAAELGLNQDFLSKVDAKTQMVYDDLISWDAESASAHSNCKIVHRYVSNIHSNVEKEWSEKLSNIYVGKSFDMNVSGLTEFDSNRYISISSVFTNLSAVFALTLQKYARVLDRCKKSPKLTDQELGKLRIHLDKLTREYRHQGLSVYRGTIFGRFASVMELEVAEAMWEYAEEWMIAHEFAHVLINDNSKGGRKTSIKRLDDLLMHELIGPEYSEMNKKWQLEIKCDLLACMMLAGVFKNWGFNKNSTVSAYRAIMGVVVALNASDYLNRSWRSSITDTHPPLMTRVRICLIAAIHIFGEMKLSRWPGVLENHTLARYASTLLDFTRWSSSVARYNGAAFGVQQPPAEEKRISYSILGNLLFEDVSKRSITDKTKEIYQSMVEYRV